MNAVGLTRAAQLLNAARAGGYAARAGGYAIPAFNAVNLETAQAIVRAAELALVFTNAVRAQLENPKLNDPRKYLGAARDAMTQRAQAVIRLLGANGKADVKETVGV